MLLYKPDVLRLNGRQNKQSISHFLLLRIRVEYSSEW